MNEILLQIIVDLVNGQFVQWLTFIVLALTLGFVARYTVVTDKLQRTAEAQTKELIQQRRLSTMPSLGCTLYTYPALNDDNERTLLPEVTLRNIGNGWALKIQVAVYFTGDFAENSMKFDFVEAIKPSEKIKAVGEFIELEHDLIDNIYDYTGQGNCDYDIVLEFQDIQGALYRQHNKIRKGKFIYDPVKEID